MAKIVLTISADNKATQSVKLLNAEVQTLSKTLSSIKVNKNLTTQINALSKYYTNLAKAAVKVNAATTQRQIAEQKLANEVKRGRTEDQRTLKVKLQREQAELRLKQAQDKAAQTTQKQTKATKQGTKANEEHRQSILSMTRGIFEWQIATTLVMKPLRMLRSMLQSINETLVKTEDAVIALQRVLPSGSASDSEISSRLYKIAQDYGQTFENVQQIAQNFARTGMSWADTIKATEAAVLALNVAELNAEEATTGLIAILSQFGLEASDLESVIDKLNKTADNFPVTTQKILAALQRTGSAASNANLSLEETISLITALSKATGRSGENIGTALNSLIQYSRKESALNVFAGLSDESAAVVDRFRKGAATILDVWQQVSKEIQSLDSRQADLLDSYFNTEDGQSLSDALDGELEDIYTEMAGVYDTANTFRKNYFIALLGNMDTVEQAMGTLQDAAGYSQAENQKYLDTYTAKVNKLNAQWQELANSEQGLLEIKKALVDIGSVLITIIKWTGGLRTVLLAVATIAWMLVGNKIIAGIKAVGTAIGGLITSLRTAKTAAEGFNAALGLIGLAATALSLIVGFIQQAKAESQQDFSDGFIKAQTALDGLANSIESTTNQYEKYKKAVEEARAVLNDESSTTSEIATAKNTLLTIQDALTKSNSDYADSIDVINGNLQAQLGLLDKLNEEQARKQVQEYIRNNKDAIENAKKYQSETFSEISTGESGGLYGGLNDENFLLTRWLGGTEGSEEDFWGAFGEGFKSVFGGKITGYAQLGEKKTREEIIAWLEEQYDKAQWYDDKDELQSRLRSLINSFQNEDYNTSYELLHGDADSADWILRLTQEQRELFAEGKLTYQQIKEILGLEKEIDSTSEEWHNSIAKVTKKYDDLISKLEELRDLNKEAYDWEEKKLAVLEAEQALEHARNEATARRFNEATGQWEWQTDEKAIKQAEENLEKAQLELERSAYENIIGQLKKGDATNESILAILQEVAPLLGADSGFVDAVVNAFKEKTGVDVTQPAKSYDSGGIANGLGYMPKATAQPETVNNPELTAKILSPVSNAQFDKYVRDMGIMFETAQRYSHSPIIERTIGNYDNHIDNSGQNIFNGVTVGKEYDRTPFGDVLRMLPIIPKV